MASVKLATDAIAVVGTSSANAPAGTLDSLLACLSSADCPLDKMQQVACKHLMEDMHAMEREVFDVDPRDDLVAEEEELGACGAIAKDTHGDGSSLFC